MVVRLSATAPGHVEAMLRGRSVLVVVGAGGVGKTTLSAALGVAAATLGLRAIVLTVDPARRLANALGLRALDEHVQTLTVQDFADAGVEVLVPLDAAMLDVKSTFDRVVQRHAGDEARAQAILDNPLYRTASTALAGSQEYMAMERLAEVVAEGGYDLVLLDTPPSAHALDFLDAPQRMIDLFDNRAFQTLLRPFVGGSNSGSGLFAPGSLVMRGLGRFTSAEAFHDLLRFFGALSATFDGFVRRAQGVIAMLHGPTTAFVLVSATDDASTDEALFLQERLASEQMAVGAWLVNRVAPMHVGLLSEADHLTAHLEAAFVAAEDAALPPDAAASTAHQSAAELAEVALAFARVAQTDRKQVAALQARLGASTTLLRVPRQSDEPADLRELHRLARILLEAAPAPAGAPPGDGEQRRS